MNDSKLTSTGRRYPNNFTDAQKREIIAFTFEHGVAKTCEKYDVGENTISKWKKEYRDAIAKDNILFAKYNRRSSAKKSTELLEQPLQAEQKEENFPVQAWEYKGEVLTSMPDFKSPTLFDDTPDLLKENTQLKSEIVLLKDENKKLCTKVDLYLKMLVAYQ